MSDDPNALLQNLQARGLVNQVTAHEELGEHLASGFRTLYCGFDPTADSLHLGHLVPLLVLRRFQEAGHKPIVLVGGATGLIGDPSFKAAERQLNTTDVVASWADKIRGQVSQFVDFDKRSDNAAVVVNNLDWIGDMNVLTFLRDVGKHFSVNNMINKESVKQRIDREDSGISFTEFSYMLLQSLDFAELNRIYGCTLQIGGGDQWGNIVGGIDLARRMNKAQTFGLTVPLVTKADGAKFGKTESGAVWLDPRKTSQYIFYQFWMNTADADVYKFLRYFTFLSMDEIFGIEENDAQTQGRKTGQGILAREVTRIVHGEEGLRSAERITEALFSDDLSGLSEQELEQLRLDGLPSSMVMPANLKGMSMTQLFTDHDVASSGKQVKDALGRGAVFFNGVAKVMDDNMKLPECFDRGKALYGRFFLVKLGKKKHHLFEVQ
ncbi:MAG: tyrosine--tRNA ligase [Endozoicomonadaceae bacterium]|nr:tyrosine--tRNA ligase [Endozoicomonadaceae bacterium]